MRTVRGFALVQVMLFGMLVAAMVYSMVIVQGAKDHRKVSEQKAEKIAPAIYDIVNYAMEQEAAGVSGNVAGSTYYDNYSPLSNEYEQTLQGAGLDVNTVIVSQN